MKLYKIWIIGLMLASGLVTSGLLGSSKINFINDDGGAVLDLKTCNSRYISYGSLISHAHRIAASMSMLLVQVYRKTETGRIVNLDDERGLYVNCAAGDLNVYLQLLSPAEFIEANAADLAVAPDPKSALSSDLSSGVDINTIKEPSDNPTYSIQIAINGKDIPGAKISIKKDSTVQSIINTFISGPYYDPEFFKDRRRIILEAMYKDGRTNDRKRFWQLGNTLTDVADINTINFSMSAVVYNSDKDFKAYQFVRDVRGIIRTGQAIDNNNLFDVELVLSRLGESYADLIKDDFAAKKERVIYNYQ